MRILALLACAASLWAQPTFSGAAAVDEQINQAVKDGLIPGAVLLIGHDGQVVYRKAFGERALIPAREPMTEDTIFDAASLTKVVATTSSVMKLFEQGKIRLDDPVTKYLPEFQEGHSPITIRNLMTHFSGLRPDLDLKPAWSGYETGIHRALIDKPAGPPGVRFVYSDINFILMGEIVHRLSGEMLSDFARTNIFEPLGMKESMFQPPASLRPRIAPTEIDPTTGRPLRGVVHDDTSRYMGGVAGHAGLFTTADDLAKFARMLLDHGEGNGVRLFSPLTVEKFALLQQSWRPVSDRLVRPHRLHRHFHVDGSCQPHLRHPAHQRSASTSRKIAQLFPQPNRDYRGGLVRNRHSLGRDQRL
jgi:CubicO group peptidase (beta-lactamase class C family)